MLSGRLVSLGSYARSNNFFDCHQSHVSQLRPVAGNHWFHTLPAANGFGPAQWESQINDRLCWESETLLTIDSRYDLFRFLKRCTPSKQFLNEIDQILNDYGQRVPLSFPRLLAIADMYAWNSNNKGIVNVRKLAERKYADDYNKHGMLRANFSLCQNIDEPVKAMKIQMAMASQGTWPLVSVLAQVELLLNKVLLCRSRAVVNEVYDCVRDFQCPNVSGPLLCSSWVSFFTSPYSSDWQLADDLLEANEDKMLPHLDSSLQLLADHLLEGCQLNRYCVLVQFFSKSSHRRRTKQLIELLFLHLCRSIIVLLTRF